jgi:Prolyl 4-Hydroxylase alpha-subunit, N-terminal region
MGDNWLFPSFEDYTGTLTTTLRMSMTYEYLHLGSAIALMRLQDTYKLNTSQIANGEISTNFKSRKLTGKNRTGLIPVD